MSTSTETTIPKKKTRRKPFRIIICPSSDEEDSPELADADTYRKVQNLMKKGDLSSLTEFEFATEAERDAFIEGYESGVGWLGDGWYTTKEPRT